MNKVNGVSACMHPHKGQGGMGIEGTEALSLCARGYTDPSSVPLGRRRADVHMPRKKKLRAPMPRPVSTLEHHVSHLGFCLHAFSQGQGGLGIDGTKALSRGS
ncbi:hypothetical protein O6H91_16G053300 [Diphasiastrum complanatum]|uniref:Uncharacterized protein n=1 Tax=Diphasiastrum complanatum TaxID=34168 RepID=A0ACC2BCC4_DIPCM|nr:hypothetical protein O6H91_16G053300 [Diphasiastrum complanatum]